MPSVAVLLCVTLAAKANLVTYRSSGARLETILRAVSKQVGRDLHAAKPIDDDILVVDVHNVPLEDLQRRLALAAGGEWRGGVLVRTAAVERRLREADARGDADRLADQLKKLAEGTKPIDAAEAKRLATEVQAIYRRHSGQLGDGQGWGELFRIQPSSPSGRAASRLLVAIGPKVLAQMRPGARVVYSTQPTRMQQPFPFDVGPYLSTYHEEQTRYAEALRSAFPGDELKAAYSSAISPEPPKPFQKALVAVERGTFASGFTVRLMLIDAENKISSRSQTNIQVGSAGEIFPGPAPKVEASDPLVPLSSESADFCAAAKLLMANKPAKLSDRLKASLLKPEERDPLSYVFADAVFEMAKVRHANVVATTNDISMLITTMLPDEQGRLTLPRFETWLKAGHDLRDEDGWLVVVPKRFADAEETRIDRAVLGGFYRRQVQEGSATLEQLGDFVIRAPRRYTECLSFIYSFLVAPEVNGLITLQNIDMMRLYGALGPEGREALLRQGTLQARNLTATGRGELAEMAFRAEATRQRTYQGPVPVAVSASLVEPAASEPTEGMPNGIPDDATVSVGVQAEDAVLAVPLADGAQPTPSEPLSPWNLAFHMALAENPGSSRREPPFRSFRYGTVRKLHMDIRFTPILGNGQDLVETRFPKNSSWVSYSQLPESYRKKVEEALPRAREQVAQMQKGNPKPPPP